MSTYYGISFLSKASWLSTDILELYYNKRKIHFSSHGTSPYGTNILEITHKNKLLCLLVKDEERGVENRTAHKFEALWSM